MRCRALGMEQGGGLNPLRGITFNYTCTSATLKALRAIVTRSASAVVVSGISPPDLLIVDHYVLSECRTKKNLTSLLFGCKFD
jgi:hypothetical protein